jgi:hypothetical protein
MATCPHHDDATAALELTAGFPPSAATPAVPSLAPAAEAAEQRQGFRHLAAHLRDVFRL